MKLFKILPAAAGMIALTSSVAFAQDVREREENVYTQTIITAGQERIRGAASTNALYQVTVIRGDKEHLVLIDAATGKVVKKQTLA